MPPIRSLATCRRYRVRSGSWVVAGADFRASKPLALRQIVLPNKMANTAAPAIAWPMKPSVPGSKYANKSEPSLVRKVKRSDPAYKRLLHFGLRTLVSWTDLLDRHAEWRVIRNSDDESLRQDRPKRVPQV